MTGGPDCRGALEAVDRILNRGGDPNQVLRSVLEAVHAHGVPFARIRLFDADPLAEAFTVGAGSAAGETVIAYAGVPVGALEIGVDDRAFAERLATLVSAVCAGSAEQFRAGA